ncbi:TetR/AcrR family transcriptional regulator [Ectobacillus sp. JY-23]|uniref:TetR/AcrR family transcriptional regulator n=1 Tax=Ectobacillus sp. JY-23 TaxID=2933872 RepID=UPI001FF3EBE0|nr:TetR/AcrR family transcriptional regulator [Ectobacillus sp. JY-23]UOY92579.1 TetR/AcrR family transcriptional regulator [Ectobacillus sp. JY-23]
MNHLAVDLDPSSTKHKILVTSIELFSRKGYSAVSVREITKAVGVKESSLYNHFKSKEDILQMIYDMFQTQHRKALPDVSLLPMIVKKQSVEQFLTAGVQNFKDSVQVNLHEKMWRIVSIEQFRDQRARDIVVNQIYGKTIEFLEVAFKAFMTENKIKEQDARQLAIEYQYPVFTMMMEFMLLRYDNKDTAEVEQKMQQHVTFFLHYLER